MNDTKSELVWYIAREGQQHGPLSDAEMRLFVKSGHLKPTDLVWNPEMPEWQSAASVFPPPPPAPPTPPKPPPQPGASPTEPRQPATAQTGAPAPGQTPAGTDHLPQPDDVLPSFRTSRTSADTDPRAATQQPARVEGYEDDAGEDDAPRRGGRIGMLIGGVAIAAAIAGGGVVAFQNKDAILKYMNEQAGSATANNAPPVVTAKGVTKTASLEKPTATAAPDTSGPDAQKSNSVAAPASPGPSGPRIEGITVTVPRVQPAQPDAPGAEAAKADPQVPLATIDSNLQKSQLWRVVKEEFPDWYKERVEEISKLSSSASETDLSKHLIGKLVALRREHASQALASSTDHLLSIASAFLANLKSLAGHSTEACYTFISKGETSPDVISLFPKPGYGDAIEGQIAAVFRAVADGRKSPVERAKATKPDYDVLASELTKIGWSKADLGLFSNPQALAKAPPEQVCKMVQDWFTAHVSIQDKSVQERLLVETLRPVVAG